MALMNVNKLNKFVEEGVAATGTAAKKPSKFVVKSLGDDTGRFFKAMIYGKGGTGKTFTIVALLLAGERVFVLNTDTGGDGLSSVEAELRYLGREELLKNVMFVNLDTFEGVDTFLKTPDKVWPEIYDWNPDFLFWDGFSNYQQIHVQLEVEEDKEVMDAMEKGSPFKYWGAVKRETQREFNRFLLLHNKKTGKLWHKIVTCLEDDKLTEDQAKSASNEIEKMKMVKQGKGPMVLGAAAKLMGPGVDISLRAMRRTKKNVDTGKLETSYLYETVGTDKIEAKVRGLRLEPIIPADFGMVWELAKKYYGLKKDAVSGEEVET